MIKHPRFPTLPGGTVHYGDIEVSRPAAGVALLEIQRPPNNFFDVTLIENLGKACEDLGRDASARAPVLASAGKHFCAGANFGDRSGQRERSARRCLGARHHARGTGSSRARLQPAMRNFPACNGVATAARPGAGTARHS